MKKRMTIIGLTVLLIITLTAGCKKQGSQNNDQQVQTPVRGGIVTVGTTKEPDSLNPLLINKVESTGIENAIFSGLLKLDKDLKWQPDLALEVPTVENGGISADGRIIIYKLKQNVHWHDGQLFDAEDVIFTYQTAINPNINVVNREGYNRITDIQAPDSYTVQITFDQPYAPFHSLFNAVLPQHVLAGQNLNTSAFNQAPLGTGPFMFKQWDQGQQLTLEAYPEYHGSDGPYLEQVKFVFNQDQTVLAEMLEKGEIDVLQDFSYALADKVKSVKGIEVVNMAGMEWEHLDFNLDNWILQDKNVRQAIAYAIDRQEIINTVLGGQGEIAHTDIPSQSWAYNPNVKKYNRDLGKAKQLLDSAGWKDADGDGILDKNGTKLQLKLSTSEGFTSREQAQQVMIRQLKEAGIEIIAENHPNNILLGDILRNRKFDLILYAFIANPDPINYSLWHSTQVPPAGQNYVAYSNPEMDAQLEAAAKSPDLDIRKQALFKTQEILVEDLPVFPLYFRPRLNAAKQGIKGFQPNPTSGGLFWNIGEWWIEK